MNTLHLLRIESLKWKTESFVEVIALYVDDNGVRCENSISFNLKYKDDSWNANCDSNILGFVAYNNQSLVVKYLLDESINKTI